MLDVEELVGRVWNPDVRPLVVDAHRCYATGAARGSIVLTWGAVCADLIEKTLRLAEDGESAAQVVAKKIEQARSTNGPQTVATMQDVERTILKSAVELELIDLVEEKHLERLREDRNLSAHPSMRPLGESVSPSIEYARAHLATALEAVLIHPPSQGRKVVARFLDHVADPSFVGSREYVTHAFFDRVKPAARRKIVDVAVKHALLELDEGVPDPPGAIALAERMTFCVRAFSERDRSLVRVAMGKVIERLGGRSVEIQTRALGRLGDLDVFWATVGAPLADQFEQWVSSLVKLGQDRWLQLSPDQVGALSLVSLDGVRGYVPSLASTFNSLTPIQKADVISRRPGKYFVPFLVELLAEAAGFRYAEAVAQKAVLPCAHFLTQDELRQILTAWAENDQCRQAGGMFQAAVDLYFSTAHLRVGDSEVWEEFLNAVRSHDESDENYRYAALEAAIG
ncbi:hypothetical protein ACIODX_14800 [Streptomyces sp. NPDC088190]|uniref:hypothetical protein n=1 Tax=unclassified Streptomyces TaxID=2593676 RepID=UPI002E7846D5|nr:hypothetical protein [Streptomyces sp. JV190]MEE1845357.1 hypothetical protein [Streptomyces sp. JV190]